MAERIKLGGLWQNKSKDGTDYLSGRLSPTVKILIFKNNYKQPGDNSPTHIMYLAPLDPDPNAQQRGAEQTDSFFGGSELNAASGGDDNGDDDFAAAPVAAPARPQNGAPRPAAAQRPNAPAPQAARPMNAQSTNTRPAANGAAQAPRRQPTPPAPQPDDIGDFEDPFGE
jgi:hypothetical protein